MVCSISCALPLAEICHTNNKQSSSNNKNKKKNNSISSRLTIKAQTTKSQLPSIIPIHFNPNAPNTTAGGPSAAAAAFRSHGIAATRALPPILLNEAAVPCAKLTPHKQRMDRAIELLCQHRLNCSFHQESLAHAQLPCFQIAHQEPSILIPVIQA